MLREFWDKMDKIFTIYKEWDPVFFFLQGLDGCKDSLFLPTLNNRRKLIRRLEKLEQDEMIASLKAQLELFETHKFLDSLAEALFYYRIKGSSTDKILKKAIRGLEKLEVEGRAQKILASNAARSLIGTTDDKVFDDTLKRFRKRLRINYTSTESIMKNMGPMNRRNYERCVHEIYGIKDSLDDLEEWHEKELDKAISLHKPVKLKPVRDIPRTLEEWRSQVHPLIDTYLLPISGNHNMMIEPVPDSLKDQFPVAAAMAVNMFRGDFTNIMFINEDAKSDAYSLLHLLIHEEYGHCVNFSNSTGSLDKLFIECNIASMEMLATNMEYQFLKLIKSKKIGDPGFRKGYESVFRKRQVMLHLRALADIRINTDKTGLGEFVRWAKRKTRIPEDQIFREVYGKLRNPGYSLVYPYGMHLLEKLRKGWDQKRFNEKVWSLGFLPIEELKRRI